MNKKVSNLQKTIKYRVLRDDIMPLVATTTELYRKSIAFCISVIKDHPHILDINGLKRQQTTIEKLIHPTKKNKIALYDIKTVDNNIPAYFRRAAINEALSIAKSWYSNYKQWQKNNKKKRPPILKTDNLQWPLFFKGMYKQFGNGTVMLIKLYTNKTWVWRKVRVSTTQTAPEVVKELSIKLIVKGKKAYLHRTIKKRKPKTENNTNRVVAVDLNINRAVVMAIVGRDGRVYKSKFINVRQENRRRKFYLNSITDKLSDTKIISEGSVFCKDLWAKVKHMNDNLAHMLSRQIVDFAKDNKCSTIVFEHLSKLKPEKGSKSRRLNSKLMYWLKGDIYKKTVYKAQWEGIWTTRINPKNTSKFCCKHHDIYNYLETGGTTRPIQSRLVCSVCGYQVDADFNACVNIARKFFARDSQIKALNGDAEAWSKAIRFLSGCMNPLYSGLGQLGMNSGRDYVPISAPYPYPRQVKVA